MMAIRPFEYTDADPLGLVAVVQTGWPGHTYTIDEWRHRDAMLASDASY